MQENIKEKNVIGIELPITIFELRCKNCGAECGQMSWPGGIKVDLEEIKRTHISTCGNCS